MIEIMSVRELRYSSPIEVPIEKKEVIRDNKCYPTIQYLYDEIRKKLAEKTKEIYGEENFKNVWKEVTCQYDKEFLNKLLYIWKEKVFEESIKISGEINAEKEKEVIQKCLKSDELKVKLETYFLAD